VAGTASGVKMVGMTEVGATIVRIVGASASDIFLLHHKTQKMACITPWALPRE